MHTDKSLFIIFAFFITCCVSVSRTYYDNFTLYRAIPVTDKHLEFLMNLTKVHEVDFWRLPGKKYRPVDLLVGPAFNSSLWKAANNIGLFLSTIIKDVQKSFDMQRVKSYIRNQRGSFDWQNYYRLKDIYQWLEDLSEAYSNEMQLRSIGKTIENRDILSVRIVLRGSKRRSKVVIEGGIHAREWISPAFVTYMIDQLLHARYSKNDALKEVAFTYDWYFVPVLNPDGYEYSHTKDRLWRKNRNRQHGVDLNRNFDHVFGTFGTNYDPFSRTYCGPEAFSELESRAMKNFVDSMSHTLEYYLTIHSYGQYMILPYGNTSLHMANYDTVKNMCDNAKAVISSIYNTQYRVGNSYETVGYFTSGMSACWVKQTYGTPYVVTFELRDNGYDGFSLPPELIIPTCIETLEGMLSLLAPQTKSFDDLRAGSQQSSGNTLILNKILLVFHVFIFLIIESFD